MTEMKDRIKMIMDSQHMTQKVFAQFTGISEGTLSGIFNGRTQPTLKVIDSIKSKIPSVSTDWLLFGFGSMYTDNKETDTATDPTQVAPGEEGFLDFGDDTATPSQGSTGQGGYAGVSAKVAKSVIKYVDKPQRRIEHITVYYDDKTWETFVPQK